MKLDKFAEKLPHRTQIGVITRSDIKLYPSRSITQPQGLTRFKAIILLNTKEGGQGGDYIGDGKADVAWRHATSGADAIWNGGNSATPPALIGVAGLELDLAGAGQYLG